MKIRQILAKPFKIIGRNRNFVRFSFLLFVLGIVIGGAFPELLHQLVAGSIEHIKNLAQGKDDPASLTRLIFLNNLFVSMLLIVSGVVLSVFTIWMTTLNGLVIGYLFSQWGAAGKVSIWAILFLGILPHGIFEIPAFILAGAMGIKLGFMWLRPIPGKSRAGSFLYAAKETLWILPVIVVLLLIAALIEGHVTRLLLEWFLTTK